MDPSTSPGRRHGEAYQPSGFSHAGALCYPSSPLPLRDRLAVGHAALDRGTEVRILVQQPTFCSGRDGDTGQSSSPTCVAHSSRGLGRRPLTAVTRVRIPYALPFICRDFSRQTLHPDLVLQPFCNQNARAWMVANSFPWDRIGLRSEVTRTAVSYTHLRAHETRHD